MLDLYAFNLAGGEDATQALSLYSKLLGGEVLVASPPHSELQLPNGQKIIFSKPSTNCPVSPGTLTLSLSEEEKEPDWVSLGFTLESRTEKYASFLDPWKNRVWMYPKKN